MGGGGGGWGGTHLVQHRCWTEKPGTIPMQVQFPSEARNFSARVCFQ